MKMTKLAVVRFSALGDVLLLWPVMCRVAQEYPEMRITFFTRNTFEGHLPAHPSIQVVGLDIAGVYRNPMALNLFFYGWIRSHNPVAWVDAHAHLRSRIGTLIAGLLGARIGRLNKHREERRAFLRKRLGSLRPVQTLYAEAFEQAGLPVTWPNSEPLDERRPSRVMILAPFSAQKSKSMRLTLAESIAQRWIQQGGQVVLMASVAEALQWGGPEVIQPAIEEELGFWQTAAVALVTDSANQHLAALHGTPSVTLWMGTSPQAGFAPHQHSLHRDLMPSQLACFPCSIYGKPTCIRTDFACKNHSEEEIWQAIQEVAAVAPNSFF